VITPFVLKMFPGGVFFGAARWVRACICSFHWIVLFVVLVFVWCSGAYLLSNCYSVASFGHWPTNFDVGVIYGVSEWSM